MDRPLDRRLETTSHDDGLLYARRLPFTTWARAILNAPSAWMRSRTCCWPGAGRGPGPPRAPLARESDLALAHHLGYIKELTDFMANVRDSGRLRAWIRTPG